MTVTYLGREYPEAAGYPDAVTDALFRPGAHRDQFAEMMADLNANGYAIVPIGTAPQIGVTLNDAELDEMRRQLIDQPGTERAVAIVLSRTAKIPPEPQAPAVRDRYSGALWTRDAYGWRRPIGGFYSIPWAAAWLLGCSADPADALVPVQENGSTWNKQLRETA